MKSQIYNQPKYYEIAFSFIDAKKQVALFEKFIQKYSKIKVKKILDIACGPALQLREFARKKYFSIGIDSSTQMINYLRNKSKQEKIAIKAIKADMNHFTLNNKVDFSYILMGSIIYTKNNELFLSHLNSVASSLRSGGLYLIENLAMNWSDPNFLKTQSWTIKEKDIKIKTTYKIIPKDSLKQIITQELSLDIDDKGHKLKILNRSDLKIIFPEEFKLLVEKSGKFEFLGFFERRNTKILKNLSLENIALLRKK